jgi:hypothetical protein
MQDSGKKWRPNSSSPRATQPKNTDVKLKDHQLALLHRAMKLEISRHITPWWPGNAKIKEERP